MTKKELQKAIKDRKLPKDGLSNAWDLGLGMAPVTVIYIVVVKYLCGTYTYAELSLLVFTGVGFLAFIMANLIFGMAVYCLINDRKLKSIPMATSKEENVLLVIETLKRTEWRYKKNKAGVFHVEMPFIFGATGHYLTIINLDHEILFNVRIVGTSRGRMPFLPGIDTLKEMRFKRELNETIQLRPAL